MPRTPFVPLLLIILSCFLAGCSLAYVMPPSPGTLMTVFTEPFLCGFSFSDASSEPMTASLVRSAEGDLITVYGSTANTVFFHDGVTLTLQTSGNADTPPLSLPLPAGWDTGIAAMTALFSVPPDDGFTVSHADDGFLVTNSDGSYTAVFSADRAPVRITCGRYSAEITSFSANPEIGT